MIDAMPRDKRRPRSRDHKRRKPAKLDSWDEGLRLREQMLASQPAHQERTAARSEDPVERLQKLADLRDRGALSDVEFELMKGKILGESR
jgi:hypothetical protein